MNTCKRRLHHHHHHHTLYSKLSPQLSNSITMHSTLKSRKKLINC